MYPPQTSLIPVTVSLSRFLIENGLSTFKDNYPYWYLGTTPFKFLIGPVIPAVEFLFKYFFPQLNLFQITVLLIFASYFIGSVGWIIFLKNILKITAKKQLIYLVLAHIFYLLLPWKYLSGLAIEDASYVIGRALVPFILVFGWKYLLNRKKSNLLFAALTVALVLLINSGLITVIFFGLGTLAITKAFKEGKLRHPERPLKRIGAVLLTGFFIATLWYGPGFWFRQLINPGIGGTLGVKVIFKLTDFIKNIAPLILAITVVYFNSNIKHRIRVFSLIWLLAFAILSLYRFIANTEFWMDYIAWMPEVETGIWLLIVGLFQPGHKAQLKIKTALTISLTGFLLLTTYMLFNKLQRPALLTKSLPEVVKSLNLVKDLSGSKNVYITGANVFWLNAFFNVNQLRGGRDEVVKNPDLIKTSYIFRESKNPQEIKNYLRKLNIEYVLINTQQSKDFYKDYKNVELWREIGVQVNDYNGDYLLEVNPKRE